MKLPWKLFLSVIFSSSLIFMISTLEAQATRGVRIQDAEGTEVGIYQASYALLVGASAYHKGWPKLPGVLDDIETVKRKKKGHILNIKYSRAEFNIQDVTLELFQP